MKRLILVQLLTFWGAIAAPVLCAADQFVEIVKPEVWPHQLLYENTSQLDQLLVLQEVGSELAFFSKSSFDLHAPDPSRGTVSFFRIGAGDHLDLTITSYFSNSINAGFRYHIENLDTLEKSSTADLLVSATLLGNSGDVGSLTCSLLDEDSLLFGEWLPMLVVAEINCGISVGDRTSIEQVGLIEEIPTFPFGLPLYQKHWLLGRLTFAYDQYLEAEKHFQLALNELHQITREDDFPAASRELDEATLLSSLALTKIVLAYNSEGGRYQELLSSAQSFLDSAQTVAQSHQDHQLLAEIHDHRAAAHYVQGNDNGVIENLLIARKEAELLARPRELLPILGSLGDYYKKWGQLRLALTAYLQSIEILRDENLNDLSGDAYQNIGALYRTLGDLPRARQSIENSIASYSNKGSTYRVNVVKNDLALILEEEGDLERAKQLLSESVSYFDQQEAPWEPLRLKAQGALSRIEAKLGNLDRAMTLSEELMAHEEQLRKTSSVQTAAIYINHANLRHQTGDTQYALDLLNTTLSDSTVQPADRIAIIAAQMDIAQTLGDWEGATALSEQAFALIESQQMQLESSRLGPYWNGKMQDIFSSHIDFLLSDPTPNNQQRAFAVSERARAVSLRMRRQEVVLAQNSGNPEARQAWMQLLKLAQDGVGKASDENAELAKARRISEATEAFFSTYSTIDHQVSLENLSLSDLVAQTPDDTLLLNFVIGEHHGWRFDISSTSWTLTDLGPAAEIAALIEESLFVLSRSSGNSTQNVRLLSDKLLKDFVLTENTKHLLISPAGRLNSLPFSSLVLDNVSLIESASISMVPSFSEYFERKFAAADKSTRLKLAVLADPIFGPELAISNVLTETQALRNWSETLERLPSTAREADALSSLFAQTDRLILTGARATREQFFSEEVRNAQIIHVATHGYFNESMPELVGFALSSQNDLDGFISMADISTAQFNSDLVVISACSTGQGEEIPGEGNMSLARAFLAQGVNSVVSTLWPVSDPVTALFMKEFYSELVHNGNDYALALQHAQQALRQTPSYRNPYYWSAYTLTTAQASAQ